MHPFVTVPVLKLIAELASNRLVVLFIINNNRSLLMLLVTNVTAFAEQDTLIYHIFNGYTFKSDHIFIKSGFDVHHLLRAFDAFFMVLKYITISMADIDSYCSTIVLL